MKTTAISETIQDTVHGAVGTMEDAAGHVADTAGQVAGVIGDAVHAGNELVADLAHVTLERSHDLVVGAQQAGRLAARTVRRAAGLEARRRRFRLPGRWAALGAVVSLGAVVGVLWWWRRGRIGSAVASDRPAEQRTDRSAERNGDHVAPAGRTNAVPA